MDIESAKRELPALLKGDLSILPVSGMGSNVGRVEEDRRVPMAIMCGGAIPKEEYEDLRQHINQTIGREVIWLKIYPEDVIKATGRTAPPPSGPDPRIIAAVFREKLAVLA